MNKDLDFVIENFDNVDFLKNLQKMIQSYFENGFDKKMKFLDYMELVLKISDLVDIKASDLPGGVDIITGGFPCQDLSVAGRKSGLDGERSGLFSEILRLAKETNAKYILFENSEQLICNKRYHAVFTKRLRECGCGYEAFLFRASDFGYPHTRKRAYVIAYTDKITRTKLADGQTFQNLINIKKQYNWQSSRNVERICFSRHRRRAERDFITERDFLLGVNGFSEAMVKFGMLGNSLIPAIPCAFAKVIKNIEKGAKNE